MPGGRLTDHDRARIAAGLGDGLGYAEIARRLGRPTSTISREVARNGGPDAYRATRAQAATSQRARRSRPPRVPPPATEGSARDPAVAKVFLDQFVTLMIQTGLPRMAARTFAALITTDTGTLTAAELVGQLQVSPASVSKAVAYLEQLDLIRRARDPNQRRDRYIIDDDLWLRTWLSDTRRNQNWADTASYGATVLGPTTAAGRRLDQMSQFFAQLAHDMAPGPLSPEAAQDILTVAAALLHAKAPLTAQQLGDALGWPTSRVTQALQSAQTFPDITGPAAVQPTKGGAYTIAARTGHLTASQRHNLHRAGSLSPM
jgi:Helix-turn-helix domain/MarR family